MRDERDEAREKKRLEEMARRCDEQGCVCFTDFLSPPEAEDAKAAARRAGVFLALEGGYEGAERRMARFSPWEPCEEPFPITALELRWPFEAAPAHRDILGAVTGLGLQRRCLGDIAMESERAILFAQARIAPHLRQNLLSAGRVRLMVTEPETLAPVEPAEGKEVRDTVASPRLDAVISGGFGLSRAKAALLVQSGKVKLRHLPNEHTDAQVLPGDVISVRGMGRLKVTQIGSPTKKGRFPLLMLRYGEKH